MKKKRILFICPTPSSFIVKDIKILRKSFDVKILKWDVEHKRVNKLLDILRLFKCLFKTDLCFSWFILDYAAYATFFSKLIGKKSIIVAGGFDVINMPEIGYGAMNNPKSVMYTKFALKYADIILAVSESTKRNCLSWVRNANVEIIYHGFDASKLERGNKEDLVISVGTSAWHTLKVKGIETFIKSAKFLPNIQFKLIGPHQDNSIEFLKSISSPNVEFVNYLPFEELVVYFKKAKVYVQISAQESFGSALAEAMLYECVPVVTNRGALPEVVGDAGFYAEYGNIEQTAQKIKEALLSNKGTKASERIQLLFPLEKRKIRLKEIVNDLINN